MFEEISRIQRSLLGAGLFVTIVLIINRGVPASAQTGDSLLDLEIRSRQRESQRLEMNRQILARERAAAKQEKDREQALLFFGGIAIASSTFLVLRKPGVRERVRSYLVRELDVLKQKLENNPAEDSTNLKFRKKDSNEESRLEQSSQQVDRFDNELATKEVTQNQPVTSTIPQNQSKVELIVLTPDLVNNLILQSPTRLIFLSIVTLGFYNHYWFFKTWLFLKRSQNLRINAVLCSIFPVFTVYSLSKRIFSQAETVGHREQVKPAGLPGIYFALNLFSNKLPGLLGLVPAMFLFYPILPIHRALMAYVQRSYPEYKEQDFLSGGMVWWTISGSLLWLLILFGAVFPESSQARVHKMISVANISPKVSSEWINETPETVPMLEIHFNVELVKLSIATSFF